MVKYLLILSCFILGASSCVSSKKFTDLEVLKEYYKLKGDTLSLVQKQNASLNRTLAQTKSELAMTNTDLNATKMNLGQLQSQYNQLSADYALLESNIEKLSTSSQSETKSLRSQLDRTTAENRQMKAILTNLDKAYQINLNGAVMTNDTWEQKMVRMQEVSETLDAEASQVQSLFQILVGLSVFQNEGIEVLMHSGQLIVRLGADKIFRSGGSHVNTAGRKAIKEITGVILRNSNLDVHVEGHTDTEGSDAGNWTTSAQRATAVAKEMIKNQFMPTRIHTIGRSSHDPVNPEETSAARKINRRVEIVIKPKTSLH